MRMSRAPLADEAAAAPVNATLRALYDDHHQFVWRNARRLGAIESAIDDVVQDVFVVAGRKLEELDARGSVRSWLFAITLHVVRAHRRREDRHRLRVEAFASQADGSPSSSAAAHEAADLVHRLLRQLDDERRAAIVMADLEQMSASEIAHALGWSRALVHTRLRAARQQLRAAASRLVDARKESP